MASKHTPGPWTWNKRYGVILGGPDGMTSVAETYQVRWEQAGHKARVDEAAANGRLIASAPKLLAACEQVLAAVNCNYCNALVASEYGDMLRAAIAEARGE